MATDDTILIRARAAVAGMRPGEVDRRPRKRAEALIAGGYAVRAETLDERTASEPPNRHLDRWALDSARREAQSAEQARNPIPGPVDLTEPT